MLGLQHRYSALKSGGDAERSERMGGKREESRSPAAGMSREMAVATRQSSLIKLCPELPLLLESHTQAVAYSLEDHHEGMQARMGALAAICVISPVGLLA